MIEYQVIGTCRSFKELPAGARALSVNGRDVVDTCEACGRPILEGQQSCSYPEGAVHKRCHPAQEVENG